jgi:hypothetical protein
MPYIGRCHCGAIQYELTGAPKWTSLCHCTDCRRSAGAPMVAWAAFPETQLKVTRGAPKTINSSGVAMRSFCGNCGTGLFYRNNQMLPGIVDVQSATLDDPGLLPPTIQVQTAERISWMAHIESLPAYERFPG